MSILWRIGRFGSKVSQLMKRYGLTLPDRRVQHARNFRELCNIQADAISRMSTLGRYYLTIVNVCDRADRALFSRLPVEYALVMMRR